MNDLILPAPLGQALIDYLAGQPYREVYQLVAALQQLSHAPPVVGVAQADE